MARGYVSPWEGAAEGMETGIKLGLDVRRQMLGEERQKRLDAEHAQDRAYTMEERTRKRAHEDEDREWTGAKRELEVIDNEVKDLGGQVSALAQQYGGFDKVPPEQQAAFTARIRQARQRRDQIAERVYKPVKERYEKQARELVEGLQAGRIDLNSVSDADVYRAFAGVLKRDPRDLVRDQQGSSVVGRAIKMVESGMEGNDMDSVVQGAGVILGPDLRVGVGGEGPDGTTIVDKQLQSFVPGKTPGTLYPVLKVEVSRPDGARGHYFAPVTHDRSSDPKSRVKSLDIAQTLDKVGRLGLLEEFANSPELRAKIERGANQVGGELQTFLEAAAWVKASPPKITTSTLNLGDRVVQQERTERGQLVGQRTFDRGTSPDAKERTRATGIRAANSGGGNQLVETEFEEEDPETGEVTVRRGLVRVPKAGAAGEVELPPGAQPRDKRPESQRQRNEQADAAAAKTAAEMGYTKNRDGKWVDARGRPAPEVDVQKITQAKADALRTSKTAPRKADSGSAERKPTPSQAEVDDLRKKAKQAIADGKDKAAVAKRFKDLTGLNL